MKLVGDSAFVTGGASGIGLGMARRLVQHGVAVAVVDVNADAAKAKAAELSADGARAIGIGADISVDAEVVAAIDAAEAAHGPVTLLFNNAGWASMAPIVDSTEADWEKAFAVCSRGTYLCTREVARRLIARGLPGAIVNTTSINATITSEGIAAYSAAKAAIASFTRTAALEFATKGIRVNAVAPGITRTGMSEGGFLSGRMGEEFTAHTPMGRFGEPDDIAKAALLLASDYAGWVTGVNLPVDGGGHLRGLHDYWKTANEV